MGFGFSVIILAAGSFFLLAFEQGSCLPTNIQMSDYAKKPLTTEEAVDILKLLKAALEELTDEQVLRVLKRSMLLYFKVCLFPYPPPKLDEMPDLKGAVKDESPSPLQKRNQLRKLLLESVKSVNPQETLNFLKSSIKFRLKYCSSPGRNETFPIPSPERAPKPPPVVTSTASEKVINQTETKRAVDVPELEVENDESKTTEDHEIEKMLSILSELSEKSGSSREKPSRAQDVINNPAGKQATENYDDVAKPERETRLQEPRSPMKTPNNTFAFPRGNKPSWVGIAVKNSGGIHQRNPPLSRKLNRAPTLNTNPQVNLQDIRLKTLSNTRVRVPNLINLAANNFRNRSISGNVNGSPNKNSQVNMENVGSEKKISNPFVDGPNLIVPADTEHKNEHSVVETSGKLGNAVLQENSNKGEFSSVMRIDYNEEALDKKPEMIGVDMGLVV
ncbi:uncharacterized protein [Montipora foliosa]|uniref:uncharacterized protein n=1 Tax=Montipora foliosa TaxID=591990 RepID=UPI0035F1250B